MWWVSAVAVAGLVQAQGRDGQQLSREERLQQATRVRANVVSGAVEGTGTVQYDPGAPSQFVTATGQASYIGNLFNTRNGAPLEGGTITRLSWYQGNGCPSVDCNVERTGPGNGMTYFAQVVVFPEQGTFNNVAGYFVTVNEFAFNSVGVSVQVPTTFFVGNLVPTGSPGEGTVAWGSVGAATGTYNGQGFHGHQRSFLGSNSSPVQGLNVVMRATGNIVIPVELLEFELE